MVVHHSHTTSVEEKVNVAVAFLASDVNRFSINALTGAIEQDPGLNVKLSFPHPRSAFTVPSRNRAFTSRRGTIWHGCRCVQFHEFGSRHNVSLAQAITGGVENRSPSSPLCRRRTPRLW